MSDISEQEVWLAAYCAAVTGSMSGCQTNPSGTSINARHVADQAVKDFVVRFPKFQFHSNEKIADKDDTL